MPFEKPSAQKDSAALSLTFLYFPSLFFLTNAICMKIGSFVSQELIHPYYLFLIWTLTIGV